MNWSEITILRTEHCCDGRENSALCEGNEFEARQSSLEYCCDGGRVILWKYYERLLRYTLSSNRLNPVTAEYHTVRDGEAHYGEEKEKIINFFILL